jgi:precorrin-6A/cobalt-precorrin-6A reductase
VVIAAGLAGQGHRILLSKATDVPLPAGGHPNIQCRSGPLDSSGLEQLIDHRGICTIVDATHPYAAAIRAMARRVAKQMGIRYLSFVRAAVLDPSTPGVLFAADHAAAAAAAFAYGRPVLITTGTRNLDPYAAESRRTGVPLIARVLDRPESREACRRAGIPPQHILAGRGPFSVQQNRSDIRRLDIGVLVTKDSGGAGGTVEKLQAAEAEGCRVIVIRRPALEDSPTFDSIVALLEALAEPQAGLFT